MSEFTPVLTKLYCERLFYLEEVEEIYVADGNV